MYLQDARNNIINSSTIVKNGGNQLRFSQSYDWSLENSIIQSDIYNESAIYTLASNPLKSDYNLIQVENGAKVGEIDGDKYNDLIDWRLETNSDHNSIWLDPEFVDPINNNWHLKSTAGSYEDAMWTASDLDSPGVDMGDPDSDFSMEPNENGGRINLGAYGGTEQASKSICVINKTFYRDADGDGYGNPNDTTEIYPLPTGYVSDNTDCSDGDEQLALTLRKPAMA